MKKLIPLIILLLCSSVSAEEYIIDYTSSSLPTLNEALRVSYAKIRDLEDATIATIITGDTSVTTGVTDNTIVMTAAGTQEAKIDANGMTLKAGASVNEFSTDTTMAGNSDDAVPTEKAVKAYADTFEALDYVGGTNVTVADLDVERTLNTRSVYTTLKSVTADRDGVITLSYHAWYVGDDGGKSNIFINDVAVGTERTLGFNPAVSYTQNVTVLKNDEVQIKGYVNAGGGSDSVRIDDLLITVFYPFSTVTDSNG